MFLVVKIEYVLRSYSSLSKCFVFMVGLKFDTTRPPSNPFWEMAGFQNYRKPLAETVLFAFVTTMKSAV